MGKVMQGAVYVLVLVLAGFAWRLIYVHYAMTVIQQSVTNLGQQQQAIVRQQQERSLLLARQQHEALRLAVDERCIGGTVIRINGSVYTQDVGADGRPVHCAGQFRVTAR